MRLNNTNMTSDDSGKLVLNYKIVGIESVRIEPKEFVKEFFMTSRAVHLESGSGLPVHMTSK